LEKRQPAQAMIKFHFLKVAPLKNRKLLKQFLHHQFVLHHKSLEDLKIIFCSDGYLLKLNRQFLQHDYLTDILTFNLAYPNKPVQGEVYISVERVLDNSNLMASSFAEELHRVIFHGLLHLLGYNDKTKSQQRKIRQQEEKILKSYQRYVSRGTK